PVLRPQVVQQHHADDGGNHVPDVKLDLLVHPGPPQRVRATTVRTLQTDTIDIGRPCARSTQHGLFRLRAAARQPSPAAGQLPFSMRTSMVCWAPLRRMVRLIVSPIDIRPTRLRRSDEPCTGVPLTATMTSPGLMPARLAGDCGSTLLTMAPSFT